MNIGKNTIISKNIRIRHPENFTVGDNCIIDDYSYFSAKIVIERYCHIAPHCVISGGKYTFTLSEFSGISSGVTICCESSDYIGGIVSLAVEQYLGSMSTNTSGDITLCSFTGLGAHVLILPNNIIPEGVTVGAFSMVPSNFKFEPWSIYAGVPIRKIGNRGRDSVLKQFEFFKSKVGLQ